MCGRDLESRQGGVRANQVNGASVIHRISPSQQGLTATNPGHHTKLKQ